MIRILHVYPDLMNLYGDYMNVSALARYLRESGQETETVTCTVGSYADLLSADMIFIGAGTERRMLAALDDFRRFENDIARYADTDRALLFTGSAVCLLAKSVTDAAGVRHEAMGVFDMDAHIISGRRYSELILRCELTEQPVIGNINTSLEADWRGAPLFRVEKQSSGSRKTEGGVDDNRFLTELSGPLLLRNPALLHAFAERIADRRLPENENGWFQTAKAGYQTALETLEREL